METSEPTSSGRRHPLAKCEECTLNVPTAKFAPSTIPDQVDFAIVGEAPGYKEAKEGKSFVGPSGRLLDMVLEHNGLDRSRALVTNACLCRPKDNRTPTTAEVNCCWPRLKAELDGAHPQHILALGNTAAKAVLDTKVGITSLRSGPPKPSDIFPYARVIPTVHPAACLRSSDMFPSLAADIAKLADARKGVTAVGFEPPTFKVFDDPMGASTAIIEVNRKYQTIVVDVEIGANKEEFIHPKGYTMLCIGISYAPGRAIVIGEKACRDSRVKQEMKRLLANSQVVCHNGKFDTQALYVWCGWEPLLWWDTMLASYCLDERPGTNSLEYNAGEFLGSPNWKSEIARYVKKGESYAGVPREVLYRYNAWDAANTFGLLDYFLRRLDDEGLRGLHDFLVAASNELWYPEWDGVKVDQGYNDYLLEHYLDSLDDLEKQINECVGYVINPRSPKQVKEYLEAQLNRTVLSTDAETLQDLLDKGKLPDFCKLMLQARKEGKLYGTYVKGIRQRLREGRVHPNFLLHGTVSGRLSCRNPNLQNIPRESSIRRQFVPDEGNVFLQGDYGQAELRVMATLSEDPYLREVFRDPSRDLFDEVGGRLYGSEATGNKELRIRTKAYVYGVAYGREEFSVAAEYKLSVAEARRGMHAWFAMIPVLMRWREGIKDHVLHDQDDLVTHFGRHRRFWLITDENRKDVIKEGYSFIPQSTASDICLTALGRIRRGLGSRGRIRIPVHDSILAEASEDDAEEVAIFMKHEMEATAREVFSDYVPFPVDVERGYSWGDLVK